VPGVGFECKSIAVIRPLGPRWRGRWRVPDRPGPRRLGGFAHVFEDAHNHRPLDDERDQPRENGVRERGQVHLLRVNRLSLRPMWEVNLTPFEVGGSPLQVTDSG